jgi:hypothetical protein
MEVLIDGQIYSTKVTSKDDRSWRGVVERRTENAASGSDVLLRAEVEVRSIDALIQRDNAWRKNNSENAPR